MTMSQNLNGSSHTGPHATLSATLFKNSAPVALVLLASLTLFGCANTAIIVNPKGVSNPAYLGDDEITPTVDPEDIRDNIVRSDNIQLGFLDGAYLEAYPQTGAFLAASERKKLNEKSFAEKWSNEKIEEESKKIQKLVQATKIFNTCFTVRVETSDSSAFENEKNWHGKIIVNNEEHPVLFGKFEGIRHSTSYVSGSAKTGYYSGVNTNYYVWSSVCSSKKLDLSKGFQLQIEPRFEKGIKPLNLSWATEKTWKR